MKALEKELASLLNTILTAIPPDSPEYDRAVVEAVTGRILLDVKRSGVYKARGVKQGFKENKNFADGPNFNYYSHVAKLTSARTAIFRRNRKGRKLALKDISTAFLQSLKCPEGMVKYLSMKHPIAGDALLSTEWSHLCGSIGTGPMGKHDCSMVGRTMLRKMEK